MLKRLFQVYSAEKLQALLFAIIAVILIPATTQAGVVGSVDVNIAIPGWGMGTGAGTIGSTLCTIVGWFTEPGGIGSAVASLAVIFLGIGAFFGKVTWGMALMFATGIFSIFGAGNIVQALTSSVGGTGCAF